MCDWSRDDDPCDQHSQPLREFFDDLDLISDKLSEAAKKGTTPDIQEIDKSQQNGESQQNNETEQNDKIRQIGGILQNNSEIESGSESQQKHIVPLDFNFKQNGFSDISDDESSKDSIDPGKKKLEKSQPENPKPQIHNEIIDTEILEVENARLENLKPQILQKISEVEEAKMENPKPQMPEEMPELEIIEVKIAKPENSKPQTPDNIQKVQLLENTQEVEIPKAKKHEPEKEPLKLTISVKKINNMEMYEVKKNHHDDSKRTASSSYPRPTYDITENKKNTFSGETKKHGEKSRMHHEQDGSIDKKSKANSKKMHHNLDQPEKTAKESYSGLVKKNSSLTQEQKSKHSCKKQFNSSKVISKETDWSQMASEITGRCKKSLGKGELASTCKSRKQISKEKKTSEIPDLILKPAGEVEVVSSTGQFNSKSKKEKKQKGRPKVTRSLEQDLDMHLPLKRISSGCFKSPNINEFTEKMSSVRLDPIENILNVSEKLPVLSPGKISSKGMNMKQNNHMKSSGQFDESSKTSEEAMYPPVKMNQIKATDLLKKFQRTCLKKSHSAESKQNKKGNKDSPIDSDMSLMSTGRALVDKVISRSLDSKEKISLKRHDQSTGSPQKIPTCSTSNALSKTLDSELKNLNKNENKIPEESEERKQDSSASKKFEEKEKKHRKKHLTINENQSPEESEGIKQVSSTSKKFEEKEKKHQNKNLTENKSLRQSEERKPESSASKKFEEKEKKHKKKHLTICENKSPEESEGKKQDSSASKKFEGKDMKRQNKSISGQCDSMSESSTDKQRSKEPIQNHKENNNKDVSVNLVSISRDFSNKSHSNNPDKIKVLASDDSSNKTHSKKTDHKKIQDISTNLVTISRDSLNKSRSNNPDKKKVQVSDDSSNKTHSKNTDHKKIQDISANLVSISRNSLNKSHSNNPDKKKVQASDNSSNKTQSKNRDLRKIQDISVNLVSISRDSSNKSHSNNPDKKKVQASDNSSNKTHSKNTDHKKIQRSRKSERSHITSEEAYSIIPGTCQEIEATVIRNERSRKSERNHIASEKVESIIPVSCQEIEATVIRSEDICEKLESLPVESVNKSRSKTSFQKQPEAMAIPGKSKSSLNNSANKSKSRRKSSPKQTENKVSPIVASQSPPSCVEVKAGSSTKAVNLIKELKSKNRNKVSLANVRERPQSNTKVETNSSRRILCPSKNIKSDSSSRYKPALPTIEEEVVFTLEEEVVFASGEINMAAPNKQIKQYPKKLPNFQQQTQIERKENVSPAVAQLPPSCVVVQAGSSTEVNPNEDFKSNNTEKNLPCIQNENPPNPILGKRRSVSVEEFSFKRKCIEEPKVFKAAEIPVGTAHIFLNTKLKRVSRIGAPTTADISNYEINGMFHPSYQKKIFVPKTNHRIEPYERPSEWDRITLKFKREKEEYLARKASNSSSLLSALTSYRRNQIT